MVQTDYIMRIIEQFAAFLWAIVFNKNAQNYDIALEKVNEVYNGLLNINPNEIKYLSVDEIIKLNTHKNITDNDNLKIIAILLFEEADIYEKMNGINKESLEGYLKSMNLFLKIFTINEKDEIYKYLNDIITKLDEYNTGNDIMLKIYEYYLKVKMYAKAEDILYHLLENEYPNIKNEIRTFYNKLLEKDDKELENGNLPRNEILEAINSMNI